MVMIIFTIFSILVSTSALLETQQDDVSSLTNCVVKMVEDIDYKKYSNLMDITVMNMNNDITLSALHKVEGARFISRRFFWDHGNISNVIYIVMSGDYQELEHGLSEVTSDTFWNPSARFIIVLQSYEDYSLHDVTDLLQAYNIFDEVSLISRDGVDYAIYKYNFSSSGYCLEFGHLTFWSWCSDYRTEKKLPLLYKGSVRNCRYKFIARNLWPLVNFDTGTKGIEQYFISLFQKHYGLKIDLHEFTKVDKYGNPVSNVNMIMFNKVLYNEVEGVVGGYMTNSEYSGNVSYSYPMAIDNFFYVLAHANYVDQWAAVLYKSFYTWIVIGFLFVIFCVATTFLSIFCNRKDVSYNVLIVFGYLLNKNVVRRIESGWPQTLVFSSLLFTAFIIPYEIQAILFSVTTQPVRGYEPKEPEDLENYQAVLYSEWQPRHEFARYWECGTRVNCLLTVKNSQNKSLYTIVSGSHYHVYEWRLTDDQCNMVTYRLKEPFVGIYRTIYVRRGSALIDPLNRFIHQLATTGVIEKYSSDIYSRELLKCKSRYQSKNVPHTLAKFYYIYMILIGGYGLSLLIFIYEVWVGSQHKVQAST